MDFFFHFHFHLSWKEEDRCIMRPNRGAFKEDKSGKENERNEKQCTAGKTFTSSITRLLLF